MYIYILYDFGLFSKMTFIAVALKAIRQLLAGTPSEKCQNWYKKIRNNVL